MTPEEILGAAARIKAAGASKALDARDPVNLPMIRNWAEAVGDANPVYVDEVAARAAGHGGLVAPPAMTQVWTMRGLRERGAADDPLTLMMDMLNDAGFTAVAATNCEQVYHRYLSIGEGLSVTTELESVAGPKQTALGVGWFITTRHTWYCEDETVATMLFRVLKYAVPDVGAGRQESGAGAGRALRRESQAQSWTAAEDQLPPLTVEATPTFIISTAIATRDFTDVHHDRDAAIAHGSKDIFLNILTDTGLVQRFSTDWAGPSARIRAISLRLAAPCYAYDTLVFSGTAAGADAGELTVSVSGTGQLGRHLVGTVRLTR